MGDVLLDVQDLEVGYGDSIVLSQVSFAVEREKSLALLGRNGVGKTSLLLALMGHLKARRGKIDFEGRDLAADKAFRRAESGMGWVPQEREIFASLTVDEHLRLAPRPGEWTREKVYDSFPNLAARRENRGNALSGGEQQMLAIGRALVSNPKLILLDEPLEGLAPLIVEQLEQMIRSLVVDHRTTIILVEQHPDFALNLCADCLVLERGRVVHASSSEQLLRDRDQLERLVGVRKLNH